MPTLTVRSCAARCPDNNELLGPGGLTPSRHSYNRPAYRGTRQQNVLRRRNDDSLSLHRNSLYPLSPVCIVCISQYFKQATECQRFVHLPRITIVVVYTTGGIIPRPRHG